MDCDNVTWAITPGNCSFGNTTETDRNSTEIDSSETEWKWLQEGFNKAQYFICPILFVIGITGNLMTILTVNKPQFRQLTSRYILCALAVSDSLLLFTNPFNQQFMLVLAGRDIRALSRTGCKLFFIAYRTGKMSSSWCMVMVAVERFVAVWFPLKVKSIITKKYIAFAITLVLVSMVTLSSLWTFSTDIVEGVCLSDAVTPGHLFLHKRFVVAGAVCYSIAPIAILLTLTPPIVTRLLRQQHRRKDLHSNAISRFARETNRTTIMLVAIVILYVICVTPITLVLVLTFWTNEPIFGSNKKEFIILTSVAQSFEQLNHSMNFSVYVLCSSQFRMGFLEMIGCRRKRSSDSSHISSVHVCSTQSAFDEVSYTVGRSRSNSNNRHQFEP